jgi:hypothetical protein
VAPASPDAAGGAGQPPAAGARRRCAIAARRARALGHGHPRPSRLESGGERPASSSSRTSVATRRIARRQPPSQNSHGDEVLGGKCARPTLAGRGTRGDRFVDRAGLLAVESSHPSTGRTDSAAPRPGPAGLDGGPPRRSPRAARGPAPRRTPTGVAQPRQAARCNGQTREGELPVAEGPGVRAEVTSRSVSSRTTVSRAGLAVVAPADLEHGGVAPPPGGGVADVPGWPAASTPDHPGSARPACRGRWIASGPHGLDYEAVRAGLEQRSR